MRQVPFLRLYTRLSATAAGAAAVPARKSAADRPTAVQPGRRTAAVSMTSVMAPTGVPSLILIKAIYFNVLILWHAS